MVILRRFFFAMVPFLSYINNTFLRYSKVAKIVLDISGKVAKVLRELYLFVLGA